MRGFRAKTWVQVALLALSALPSASVEAQLGLDLDPSTIEIHAYLSQGYFKTTANNYLGSSDQGTFNLTEVGINFTKSLTDNLRLGMQIYSYDVGSLGNYAPRFDWYYLDYRLRDWFGIRAGYTKIPFGLYNDSSDFDAARVPVLLPQSVYPVDNQGYLLAQTGTEVYGNLRLHLVGALEYRLYGGTISLQAPAIVGSAGISVTDLSIPLVAGGRLMWSTPLDGLRLGFSYQAIFIDFNYVLSAPVAAALIGEGLLPSNFDGTLAISFDIQLWVASLEYQVHDLLLAVEYSQWHEEFASSATKLLPPETVNERYYAMASYHVTRWLTPGVYYSAYIPNINNRIDQQDYQHDVAATLRFDINSHWLVKLEGHWMDGTAGLDPTLNDNKSLASLTKDWGLVMVKTTAYF